MLLEEEFALVARVKAGEQTALAMLWDAITPKLYGYLVKTMRDPHLAEDILQDTWLKAIHSIATFSPQGVRFSAWLFAIARNECRQHWRKNGREIPLDDNEEAEQQFAPPDAVGEKIFLDTILRQLPTDDQEILRLRYIAELSFKEIARVLEISMVSARVRVHRALGRARLVLKNE